VALFPYVAGAPLDRENPVLRQQAATFLAHLHTVLLSHTSDAPDLQRNLLLGALPFPPAPDPDVLVDQELDTWHTTILQESADLRTGLIHGDYYRRNLLTQQTRIVALLDWDDLHTDFLMQEVAWASWEFGKTPARDDWHLDRVQAFLRNYRDAGGPCTLEEYAACVPFIRWRLRQELRRHFAAVANNLPGEPEYAASAMHAFERLRNCHINLTW
jgi:Ser/Thr protein kinase RdoA (MazF antagonist)